MVDNLISEVAYSLVVVLMLLAFGLELKGIGFFEKTWRTSRFKIVIAFAAAGILWGITLVFIWSHTFGNPEKEGFLLPTAIETPTRSVPTPTKMINVHIRPSTSTYTPTLTATPTSTPTATPGPVNPGGTVPVSPDHPTPTFTPPCRGDIGNMWWISPGNCQVFHLRRVEQEHKLSATVTLEARIGEGRGFYKYEIRYKRELTSVPPAEKLATLCASGCKSYTSQVEYTKWKLLKKGIVPDDKVVKADWNIGALKPGVYCIAMILFFKDLHGYDQFDTQYGECGIRIIIYDSEEENH